MKVGRRAFVQFIAGAVGGSLLTPIPWKLADDSAIWSQNWSWRPSPSRGENSMVTTTCGLCPGGCGITAHLVDKKRAVALHGNPDHPINAGGICPLGASGLQFLYAPYRITQPLKQSGKRGDPNGFRPITWDEALTELHSVLNHLRTQGNPHHLAGITGQGHSSMKDLWQQFFTAYGSPNFFTMPSAQDGLKQATTASLGRSTGITFHLEEASYVLSFGASLFDGWGAPGRLQRLMGRWRQEDSGAATTKLVQVDSRCSLTATKADEWIPIKPGAEAALALGIAHRLIRDHLYDSEFIRQYSFGFESWNDAKGNPRMGFKEFVLAQYTPDRVTELTGVPEATIGNLAKELATQKRAIAVWGNGKGTAPSNFYHDLAFLALNALIGNLKPGGMLGTQPRVPLGELPAVSSDSTAEFGLHQPRLDLARKTPPPLPGNAVHAFLDAIRDNPAYPIDVFLIHEANPAYSLAENQLFATAVAKVGLVVSCSSFMDETTAMSDLVLPNHMALERLDDVVGLDGAPYAYYAVTNPILQPQLNTRHTGEVLLAMAKLLGGSVQSSLPWSKYQDFLMSRVKGLAASGLGSIAESSRMEPWRAKADEATASISVVLESQTPPSESEPPQAAPKSKDPADLWKQLTNGKCWYDAPTAALTDMATTSVRFEFACQSIEAKGLAEAGNDAMCLPHFRPLKPSGDEKEFPLLLLAYHLNTLTDQYLPNPPFMTKNLPDDLLKGTDMFVEVHPETARGLGLNEADRALLKTPQGEVAVRIHLSQAARPGVAFAPHGLGHTAYDEYIRNKGENSNKVIEVQIDPITGLGTVWATRAQLRRA
jgi:menaquinone reductase, molybdopterin-binding-like subunit